MRGTAARQPRKAFFTRSISDPGLIPLLIASGVTFGAIQVRINLVGTDPLSIPSVITGMFGA